MSGCVCAGAAACAEPSASDWDAGTLPGCGLPKKPRSVACLRDPLLDGAGIVVGPLLLAEKGAKRGEARRGEAIVSGHQRRGQEERMKSKAEAQSFEGAAAHAGLTHKARRRLFFPRRKQFTAWHSTQNLMARSKSRAHTHLRAYPCPSLPCIVCALPPSCGQRP